MDRQTILDQIIAQKRVDVALAKEKTGTNALSRMPLFARQPPSLAKGLRQPLASGIIAEFKRKSPSKGWIHQGANPAAVLPAYVAGGASALSILTDEPFFGGTLNDLQPAWDLPLPVLRKDFVVDEYQLIEAKAHGAAVVLLIAACLSPQQVKTLAQTAFDLGLEVLLEVHTAAELDHWFPAIQLVGINNRNLKNFAVDLEHSFRLRAQLPPSTLAIAESGIEQPATVLQFKQAGFQGFLMGERFMREKDPGQALAQFVQSLQTTSHAN